MKEDTLFSWQIVRGLNNRTVFSGLKELGQSIKEQGLIHRMLIRPLPDQVVNPESYEVQAKNGQDWPQAYQLVAGERRYRAITTVLKYEEIPLEWVEVRSMDDTTARELVLIENLGREQLNPVDEAEGYQIGMDEHGWTVEHIADFTGSTVSYIRRRLTLLDLIPDIKEMVRRGNLSVQFAENITMLSENGQRAAIQLLAKTPHINMHTFVQFRNQLRQEESQAALFDLVSFWQDQVENQKWVPNGTHAEIDVPVADDAPDVVVRPNDKTGDVIHRYIEKLADTAGYEDVAPVLGKLYAVLVQKRKIQVPAPRPVAMESLD